MRNIYKGCLASASFFVILLLFPLTTGAFPDEEKAALDLVSSQADSMVLDGNQFLLIGSGDDIFRIDLETWALSEDQVPALIDNTDDSGEDLTGDVGGLALQGDTLYASQADGDLLVIDLDDITADPDTTDIIEGTLGPLAADGEGGTEDDNLYFLDETNNAVVVYDVGSGTTSSIALADSLGAAVTPVALVFVSFPTDTSTSSTTDKVFVTSNNGLVFVINEGGTGIAATITLYSTNKELPAIAATPGGDYVLVVNATDTTVHVINTATNAEMDADPDTGGTNPISLPQNGSLEGIWVTEVSDPSDIYAFVTGSDGISVIDLNISGSTFNEPTVLDFNDEGSGDDEDDPLTLSSSPGLVIASSDGYVYTSNGNATLSVVSENPFVTISSTSLGSSPLTTGSSFTVTFQSDEAGTYRVLVGGDLTANGTEATTGTVDTADTDVTTASIAYDSSLFDEGTNRIFVFVTDGDGNVGRDAVDITVDTPPPAIVIQDTDFGSEKIYVIFERLTVSDMDHYNVYVDTDPTLVTTKTDISGTVSQPDSGETIEVIVSGLTNGVTYYVAVEGVDQTGNVGVRTSTLSDGTAASATPERTIGLAEAVGETGCSLVAGEGGLPTGILWLVVGMVILGGVTLRQGWVARGKLLDRPPEGGETKVFRSDRTRPCLLGLILVLLSSPLDAKELTPQWWSLEFKGGAWMPLNGTTKNYFGSCCEPAGVAEFGFLYKSKFAFEVGVGYVGAGGRAVGATSGAVSRDSFDFTMIPIQNSFTFRADFKEDQLLVPYAKFGLDYVIFRENVQGNVTKGVKLGLHTAGGLQILLDAVEELSFLMERSLGVNDVYFTLETRYAWVDGFGGNGVDLSNLTFSGGFLFEF